jgi:hypothetical protein
MLLNWPLGVALTLLPRWVDAGIGRAALLPLLVYRVIGAIFLLFAAWQAWVLSHRTIGPPGLVFAALMSLVPVILLTAALLFMSLPLRPFWRVLLWTGDVYMLFLGTLYLYAAWALGSRAAPGS